MQLRTAPTTSIRPLTVFRRGSFELARRREARTGERSRHRESGNSMIVAVLVLSGLLTLGAITTLGVQGGVKANAADRFQLLANYAAESGASVAMDYLRRNFSSSAKFSAFVSANNANPPSPTAIVGNGLPPGATTGPLSADTRCAYTVTLLNNAADPGLVGGQDTDGQIIVHVVGTGPDGTQAVVEVEIRSNPFTGEGRPCLTYGQKGMAEDGAGRNDCMTNIDSASQATFTPGT